MEICFLLFILFVHQSSGVIYKLNDVDYNRMPPLNVIDDYDSCLQDRDALYCTMNLKIVSDTPSDVMDLIRGQTNGKYTKVTMAMAIHNTKGSTLYVFLAFEEMIGSLIEGHLVVVWTYRLEKNYSAYDLKHFDHSKLYRGVCVTKTCDITKQEITMNINNSLENCMNESLWTQYKLKVKLLSPPNCYSAERKIKLDIYDLIVGLICMMIIIVNVVATIYDIYVHKKSDTKGVNILLSFSIIKNWSRLKQNDYRIKQPMERLKGMDGIRAIMMVLFVFGHSLVPLVMIIANHHVFENMYSNLSCHILINGSHIVQAYFVMAGILLSYNMRRIEERQTMTWKTITNNLFKRWLRLSPSFIIFLAIVSTWMRHLGSGPFWALVGTREVEDCRRYWMWNFFFLTNYNSGSFCMPHTWYLSADMHLFCFGVVVFVLVRSEFWRRVIWVSAFFLGTLSSGIVTYIYDLRTLLTIKPNSIMETFVKDPNFDYLYKPTHTNIQSYVVGLATGVLIYRLQKTQFDIQNYKKFKVLYWLLLPSIFGLIMLSSIHYRDGPALPLYLRVLHQMLLRPLFSAIYAIGIVGMVFKIENIFRAILEWEGWIWVARVAYTTYMTHFTVLRLIVGNSKTVITFSKYTLLQAGGMTVVSFAVGVVVWLLIDGPVSHIVHVCMETPTKVTNAKRK